MRMQDNMISMVQRNRLNKRNYCGCNFLMLQEHADRGMGEYNNTRGHPKLQSGLLTNTYRAHEYKKSRHNGQSVKVEMISRLQ